MPQGEKWACSPAGATMNCAGWHTTCARASAFRQPTRRRVGFLPFLTRAVAWATISTSLGPSSFVSKGDSMRRIFLGGVLLVAFLALHVARLSAEPRKVATVEGI